MSILTSTHAKSLSLHYQSLNKTLRTNKRRCESVDKYSLTPSNYDINDRETMMEEMSKLLKEIKRKTKELKALSHSHFEIESDNYKLIQTIQGLVTECKKIPQPIEKNTSMLHQHISLKTKTLYNKFQDKLASCHQELMSKDNYLTELKSNNQKILRMYEIESKLINANEQYENTYMKYAELAKKITKLDQQSPKLIEETNQYKVSHAKLEKEKNELIDKIKNHEMENHELLQKGKFFDEKIASIKRKFGELRSLIKEKNDTLKLMKEKMINYQCLISEKEKSDSMIANQIKQIQLLKDKDEKASKQIKEIDTIQGEYINKITLLKSTNQIVSPLLLSTQKERNEKNEEYSILQKNNALIKEKKQGLLNRLNSRSFEIQKQISYSLNIPLKIDFDLDEN